MAHRVNNTHTGSELQTGLNSPRASARCLLASLLPRRALVIKAALRKTCTTCLKERKHCLAYKARTIKYTCLETQAAKKEDNHGAEEFI
ncbi:hypothetical protein NDU88_005312 [Pleurodeles waltl]|uniref:Uncharacterized protein n=1 Tax=Pleurodeles waltl TaxID=8319 RepID=A0AAV7L2R9_PLEWA|nr:hypothetical protein NDU88_005312 [Pleurodeles waltl]